jgi:hypothetical protein
MSKHHDVVSSGIFVEEFHDKHPREWAKHAFITLTETMEVYMVEVTATSHYLNKQLIS